jgi:hypothetical protein
VWPQKRSKPPLELRLIRLPGRSHPGRKRGKKHDLWLATNVLDPAQLSRRTAGEMFRRRWEQEVFYRSYKCTLGQAKLAGRTVRQVVREAELAMLGVQLFLAQAAWALQWVGGQRRASAAEAARQYRREMRDVLQGGLKEGYLQRLGRAEREDRAQRTSPKNYREWPRKRPHKVPGPPRITRLTRAQKRQLAKELQP